jgi:hypothetical protein
MDTLRLEFIHPDGRSICATTLHTKGDPGPAAPAALAAKGPVRLSETEQNVTVEAAGTQLVLDKHTGQITSWRADGQDVILGGPILNLGDISPAAAGRRGGAGGGGRGRGAAPGGAQPLHYSNLVVTASMVGSNARIAVTADVYQVFSYTPPLPYINLDGLNELKAQLTYTFDISPDAQADVTWNLAWKAADATAHEAGFKFLLPATTDRMSWFSESRWTEYPPGHIASPYGSVTSKDAAFGVTRRDVHWMSLSGASDFGVVALGLGKPLHAHE